MPADSGNGFTNGDAIPYFWSWPKKPDDKWVVFSRSHCEAGDDPAAGDINANVCDSYNDTTARSWIVLPSSFTRTVTSA